jgi:SAM-dependent methyltransferase
MGPEGLAGLPDGCLDLVVAAEVLEHIDDLGPVLADFRRLLKPGGRLLVSLPTEGRLYRLGRRLAGFDGHFHVHNAASIDATIQAAGWAPTERAHIPAPGPLAIYLVAAYAPAPA